MARLQGSDLDFNNASRIINLLDPVAAQQPATKAYVDSAVEGLAWKDSARVASTANINLAAPGASIDAIAMVANDRFLAKDQTAAAENGIYIWNGAATPATRSLDANTAAELEQACVTVEEGTSTGATFRQTQLNFVLGTNNVVWGTFGTAAPAATETVAGIAEIATQAETDTGTDDVRFVTALKLKNWSGRKFKAIGTVGDGSATSYVITHNLNTKDVQVEFYRNSGVNDTINCDVERTSVNSITAKFAVAPTANQFAYVILG